MIEAARDVVPDPFEDVHLLERLSQVPVNEVMRSPAVVFVGAETMALRDAAGRRRFIYVIERDGRLVGWLDTSEIRDGHTAQDLTTHLDPGTVSISPDQSLCDALLRMLELGYRTISVTDDRHRLVGEVTMATIEDVTGEEAT